MSAALGFLLNAAGILVPVGLQAKYDMSSNSPYTSVQIIAGNGGNHDSLGGNVPHIAVWDDDGHRIGQYHPNAGERIKAGDYSNPIVISNTQNGGEQADPYYVMLSNLENDAICIAAITVANQKVQATFYGDTGYRCGQSWFLSQNKIGSNFQKPKCVWLDADHSSDINARALSFHLNDMSAGPDKLAEYQKMPETLCHSTPRFSFWGNLLPNGVIPFFKPKLEYKVDSSTGGEGADKDPKRVIDKPNEYNKAVYLHQGETSKRAVRMPRRGGTARGANHNPEHLIVTDHPDDNVREVCEHPNSYGWDIVSTVQSLYCDMEHKQLYNVCDSRGTRDNCFDMEAKMIVAKASVNVQDELSTLIPRKNYTSHAHWER